MRRPALSVLALGLALGTTVTVGTAVAQPGERDHRHDKDKQPPPPPPAPPAPHERDHRGHDNDHKPHQAPPAPQAEAAETKAGFVWAKGRWDWKNDKWEWVAGHWEREQAGKQWRDARWDEQGGTWVFVDGSWTEAGAAATPPPTTGPATPPPAGGEPPVARDHRRAWKLERPTISSYWPIKGKAGAKVVIRGQNFPADTQVLWAGTMVPGVKVTADTIVVPAGAASGAITLHTGHGRDLVVGGFEVAAAYDAAAEQKRIEDEARKKAEADWAERQKALAADQAARATAADKRWQEMATTRDHRREAREAELRAKWDAAFLADPATQDELTLHAQRVAQLARAKDLAETASNGKLVVRIGVAQSREDQRHEDRMAALKAAFGGAK